MATTRIAIIGATGYSGGELVALLSRHPKVELVALQGQRRPNRAGGLFVLAPDVARQDGAGLRGLVAAQAGRGQARLRFPRDPQRDLGRACAGGARAGRARRRSVRGVQVRGGRRLLVVSALDNLLKGAASQAVQSFNLASGLPMTAGLA
jgi:aspartate-semialdehyde dehydrogenase